MEATPYQNMQIQWFPGHMTKAQREIRESMKLVDAVCELLDARIPASSRNPDIDELTGDKPRLLILNRCDLADPAVTARWRAHFRAAGLRVLETDAKSGRGVKELPLALRDILKEKRAALAEKGQASRPMRVVILGIPNVGKSTLINRLAGRRAAVAGDKPGVTRGRQWIRIDRELELLDTPGILWPRFSSQAVGEALALTGAIKTEVFDTEALAANFLLRLRATRPELIEQRYKFAPDPEESGYALLERAARKRGMLIPGGEADTERMARTLLREYHAGKLGALSLETPESAAIFG